MLCVCVCVCVCGCVCVSVRARRHACSLSRVWPPHGAVAQQAPLSLGFSRQEYWMGLPFPSPGHLPDPGMEPVSPALQADSLLLAPPGKPNNSTYLRYLELSNAQRQKADGGCQGLREGDAALTLNGDKVSIWGGGKFCDLWMVVMVTQQHEQT